MSLKNQPPDPESPMDRLACSHHAARARDVLKAAYLGWRGGVLRLLPQAASHRDISPPVRSVLVISQLRLGDIALEIPALRLLRKSHEEMLLGIVAPAALHPLFKWACQPQLLFDIQESSKRRSSTGAAIRAHPWQVVVDLTADYHLAPARLAAATGAAVRLGFDHAGRGRYFSHPHLPIPGEHASDQFLRILQPLGVHAETLPELPEIEASPLPLPARQPGQRRIGLQPGAAHWTQRWPAEHFGALARHLCDKGNQCLVLGLPGEAALVRDVERHSRGAALPVLSDAGILSYAATLQQLDLLICNNSGPLHLAGLLGVATLSFMGPTIRERWWPRGSAARVLRRDDLPCIGCNRGYCRISSHACLREISPEEAYEVYEQFHFGALGEPPPA